MIFCNIVAFNLLVLDKEKGLSSSELYVADIAKKAVLDDESNVRNSKDKRTVLGR
jgi:hypothetical protein